MNDEKQNWLDRKPVPALPWLTIELLIFGLILVVAVISRFYDLGARAMSHDESLHTYFSYLLYKGQGYQHNPMMHGPLQFHLIALTYFLFGSSDFTARIPAATFSVLAIAAIWIWRRYLGRTGALVAALMALVSPFLLFYGRYTREDSYVAVSSFILFFSILRYFETGKTKYIYFIAGSLVIHFLTKETAFIYTAQLLIYLFVYFLVRIMQKPWNGGLNYYRGFIFSLTLGVVLLGASGYLLLAAKKAASPVAVQNPAQTSQAANALAEHTTTGMLPGLVVGLVAALSLATAVYFLSRGYGLENIRQERSFDLLMVFGTIVLPMLSAFPVSLIGWDPLDYGQSGLLHTALFLGPIVLVSVAIGWWWKWDVWWKMALIFWSPYILLYTTIFTNGGGFFTGTVGSLGYWLQQQGVQRGSQPWYYYLLVTIPVYEFLPAAACFLAAYLSLRKPAPIPLDDPEAAQKQETHTNFVSLLAWWTIITVAAFTLAGEKMPWLTFHMVLPMVLWGGWAIGTIIDRIDWQELLHRNALLVVALLAIFTLSIISIFISLLGSPGPFQGQELAQLQATTSFIFALVGALASAFGLYYFLKGWDFKQALYLNTILFFGLLFVLTVRTSFRANYIKYNSGQEYLVYAHSYSGVKDLLSQVEDLSQKTVGGKDIVVAYDDDTSWPMSWYMREYPNSRFYGAQPDRSLKDVPAIIVGNGNYSKIEPIVGNNYYQFDYIRMVWPNQDYFNLVSTRPDPNAPFDPNYSCTGIMSGLQLLRAYDFSRICSAVGNPDMRKAIFNIWLNRDYTLYGQLTNNKGVNEATWDPSDRMRLYIRKDAADLVWKYGIKVAPQPKEDPYAKGVINLPATFTIGSAGSDPGQFNAPRGLAFSADGSVYVADSRNNRIQHLAADGTVIKVWGTFADQANGNAPIGTFNEPWGVAVGPDGSVYVSDTWNHRVQKFTADGTPIKMWGIFGTADTPGALYGPRGISVDRDGNVYVADTGNKRIVVYDPNGNIITMFGSEGLDPGQFSEPVDVKVDSLGKVYVTDTWNQRIQVLETTDGKSYTSVSQWPISGWLSQSLDNKPFIAVNPDGNIFVTDPEGYRVIEFNKDGQFVQVWGQFGTDNASFGLASGVAIDPTGDVWVTDSANNRLMRFSVPAK